MRFGCCTPARNYDTLASLGYDYIELSAYEISHMSTEALRDLGGNIRSRGVPCLGFNEYCREELSIVGEDFREDATREYARRICQRGADLGIQSIGIGAPRARRLPPTYPRERAWEQGKSFLAITAEVAAEYGIQILFESLHRHMCDFVHLTREALQMVEELNLENLHLVMDFFQMDVMGEDLEDIGFAMHQVRHTHINHWGTDYAREYLSEADEALCRRIFTALKEQGYNDTMSVEAVTEQFEADALRSLKVLQKVNREIYG